MQSHTIGGYKLQISTQKPKRNVKCSLCVDFIIINKELTTANFSFPWLSLPQQWCHTNTQLQQPKKAKVRKTGIKSPTKANTDHYDGDLK